MPFAYTVLVLLVWLVQGIGFAQWLGLRRHPLVGWVLAMWLGLVLQIVVAVNAYYLLGLRVGSFAWPITLALSAISLALYFRTKRPESIRVDVHSWVVIIIAVLATMLVLRPLLGLGHLGFYFSNNGEFSNYAGMADAVQYNDASTNIGFLGTISREAVAGVLIGTFSSITGKAGLWVTQPVSAAFAALAFASLGVLFHAIASKLRPLAAGVVWSIYAWAVLSASAQCFWTLSFVSQYISVALFFGGIAFLTHARELAHRRFAVLGVLLGALAVVYPEMFLPNVALLCAFELAAAEPTMRARIRSLAGIAIAIAIAAVVANRLGAQLVLLRGGSINGAGWDIYGPHRPILGFVASLGGFTNTFGGPQTRHMLWGLIPAVLIASAILHALVRAWRDPDPATRGSYHLGYLMLAGVAAAFWLIVKKQLPTNYMALKIVLGFGWLAYLVLALGFARLATWQPRAAVAGTVIMAIVWFGLARPAELFTKNLYRAKRFALFHEDDAVRCRAAIKRHMYVSSDWFNYAIIGQFVANDRDLNRSLGNLWPGNAPTLKPGEPVLVLGDKHELAKDPQITAPYREACRGHNFIVYEPQ